MIGPGIEADLTIEALIAECEERLEPLERWRLCCHEASLHLVRADNLLPEARVCRGACVGVGGQHSWVILGMDCYDEDALIIDPTLWSYDTSIHDIWFGSYRDGKHRPHGMGTIWGFGRPHPARERAVELTPREPFSETARAFLDLLGPLDRQGWAALAHAPVQGWPAAEILPAINDTIGPLVPIDIIGMLTDRNPSGLYLRGDS